PIQHHAITREDAAYARTGFEYNSRSFVPHDSLGRAREHLMIRMAHAAGLDLHQHFAKTGITNIYLIDFEIPLPIGDSGLGDHRASRYECGHANAMAWNRAN